MSGSHARDGQSAYGGCVAQVVIGGYQNHVGDLEGECGGEMHGIVASESVPVGEFAGPQCQLQVHWDGRAATPESIETRSRRA